MAFQQRQNSFLRILFFEKGTHFTRILYSLSGQNSAEVPNSVFLARPFQVYLQFDLLDGDSMENCLTLF